MVESALRIVWVSREGYSYYMQLLTIDVVHVEFTLPPAIIVGGTPVAPANSVAGAANAFFYDLRYVCR